MTPPAEDAPDSANGCWDCGGAYIHITLYCATPYWKRTLLHYTTRRCTALHNIARTALHYSALHCTALHCSQHYFTAPDSSAGAGLIPGSSYRRLVAPPPHRQEGCQQPASRTPLIGSQPLVFPHIGSQPLVSPPHRQPTPWHPSLGSQPTRTPS